MEKLTKHNWLNLNSKPFLKFFRLINTSLFIALLLLTLAGSVHGQVQAAGPQFVKVQGNNLVLNGQPIKLKGHNFYPFQNPWAAMWQNWQGPEVAAEVGQAAILGDNVLRVLVPYDPSTGWTDAKTGQVNPVYLAELRQMVQIAAGQGMKVIITLFDFYDGWPPAGSAEEAANLTYLATIVGAFAGDDRVLSWDIHNEPDFYPRWTQQKQPDAVLDWTARMRQAISNIDSNHLITVGVGFYEDIWYQDSQGRSFAGLSDYISLHSYNALDFGNEVYHIREHTSKPILLEETGWPTGPTLQDANFTETEQLKVYQQAIQTVTGQNLVGLLGWVLRDQVPGSLIDLDQKQNYYGIERRDGTLKPAALVFRDQLQVSPFTAAASSAEPLTSQNDPNQNPADYFPQTGHYLSSPLAELWRRAGGETIFGLPLTDAYVDRVGTDGTSDGPGARIVQYFEKARFEYYPARLHEPGFKNFSHISKYFYLVDFGTLGKEIGGSDVPESAKAVQQRKGPDTSAYHYFDSTGHDLAAPFLDFWNNNYGAKLFGNPISQPFNRDGQILQYFENALLEYDPTAPNPVVTVAPLGKQELAAKGIPVGSPADLAPASFTDPSFQHTWRRTDLPVQAGQASRSWLWGPQGFATALEPYAEADHNGWRLVEYFDKSRMEITHSDGNNQDKYFVTNGLLVKELISGQLQTGDNRFESRPPAQVAIAGDPLEVNPDAPTYAAWQSVTGDASRTTSKTGQPVTVTLDKAGQVGQLDPASPEAGLVRQGSYIPETGHNIPDVFWRYLTQNQGPLLTGPGPELTTGDVVDWLYSTGLPLSEAFWVNTRVGGVEQPVLVQPFERRVLTYTPSNPAAYQVEMGNVGRHYYQWRYLNSIPAS
ncbi:MAG: hypothetical protein BGO39_01230 [Chloroflexi bacterium 54-19]|nr:MAG: hypothetical protein BGO39_01230 [Chloroflexi bacterium 54-19]